MHAWFLDGNGPLIPELRAAGARVRVIGWSGGRRDLAGAWRFWNALHSQDYAIVHQHSGGRSLRWLARCASRASIILHIHGTVDESKPDQLLVRKVSDADAVIATSHAVAELVLGVRPHIVYPGVRIPRDYRPTVLRPTAGGVIGTACRLVAIKGIVHLIRAMAVLSTQFPDVCLEIAGLGPEQDALQDEVRCLRLGDRVKFLGWQAEVERLLQRWDIFAMPSLEEGFGIAALEAMAAGLPVVATNVGGIPELVENGRTGWLVPPGNPQALAERVCTLLLNPEMRYVMGAAGRARARSCFSMDRMVASIARIYDDILGISAE